MTDQTLEQRARGLLASEFPLADGFSAVLVRDMSIPQLGVVDTAIALRAIVAALQAQQPGAQAVTDAVRELPEKWRGDSDSWYGDDFNRGRQAAAMKCATELESALASQQESRND